MATYRQMVFMVLDELKLISDDAYFTEDHVMFLLSKYRALIVKQELEKDKFIKEDNYQTICLKLEESFAIPDMPCEGGKLLKSVKKIPDIESGTIPQVFAESFFNSEITYVSRERFRYVGNNRWLQNIIYAAIGPDDYLYLKSSNPQYIYLRDIKFSGIFSDPEEVSTMLCEDESDEDGEPCDVLDTHFPLEEAFIPQCIQLVVKELSGSIYRPKDPKNDAADNLSEIATYLRNNMKSNFQKQIDGD